MFLKGCRWQPFIFAKIRRKFQQELERKRLWDKAEIKYIGRSKIKLFFGVELYEVGLKVSDYLFKNNEIDEISYNNYKKIVDEVKFKKNKINLNENIIKKDVNDSSNVKYLKKEEIGLEIFDKVNYKDFRKYIVLSPKDNGRYDLFVYINLAPLKYSKVILGPKVTDVDYIAPYLKLANPDIEIESSKIPYR